MSKYINIAEQKLIDSINKKECIFFVGSGISKFKPTNLPDGSELRSFLLNSLLDFSKDKKLISNLAENIHLRPEVCFQYFYKYLGSHIFNFFGLFQNSPPNPCHLFIAKLFERKYIDYVITTNYDDGIENALNILGLRYKSVVTGDEFMKPLKSCSIIKLHGCAMKDLKSCLLNLEDVSFKISKIKAEIVRKISRNKIMVFLGYKGNDLNIFPILKSLECKSILWVFRTPKKPTDSIRGIFTKDRRDELVKRYNGVPLQRDLLDLIKDLSNNLGFSLSKYFKLKSNIERKTKESKMIIKKHLDKFLVAMILGDICEHLGMNKEALRCYRDARKNANLQNWYLAELGISKMLSVMGDKTKATEGYERVITSFKNAKIVSKEIILTYQRLAESLRLQGKLSKAENTVNYGIILSKTHKDYAGLGWCLLTKANILSDQEYQNKEEVISLYKKSLFDFRKGKDIKGYAQVLNDLAAFYYTENVYLKAYHFYQRAGEYFSDISEKTGLGITLSNLGIIKTEFGEFGTAKEYQEESFLIFSELNNKRRMATSLANLGWLYLECNQIDKALTLINNSLEIAKRISFQGIQYYSLILKATCYLLQKQKDSLIKTLHLLERSDITEKFVIAQYLLLKIKVCIFNHNLEKAKHYINKVVTLLNKQESYDLGKSYFLEGQIFLREKEFSKAILRLRYSLQSIGSYNNFLSYIFVTHFMNALSALNFKKQKSNLEDIKITRKKILRKMYDLRLEEEINIADNILETNKINGFLIV